jgi:hypothetical protein
MPGINKIKIAWRTSIYGTCEPAALQPFQEIRRGTKMALALTISQYQIPWFYFSYDRVNCAVIFRR